MSIQCYCIIAHTAVCIVLLEIVYIDTAMEEDVLIDTKQEAISYHWVYKYNHLAFLEEAHIIAKFKSRLHLQI